MSFSPHLWSFCLPGWLYSCWTGGSGRSLVLGRVLLSMLVPLAEIPAHSIEPWSLAGAVEDLIELFYSSCVEVHCESISPAEIKFGPTRNTPFFFFFEKRCEGGFDNMNLENISSIKDRLGVPGLRILRGSLNAFSFEKKRRFEQPIVLQKLQSCHRRLFETLGSEFQRFLVLL